MASTDMAAMVSALRSTFNSGKTKSYEFRIHNLQQFAKMVNENTRELNEAVYKDLRKSYFESELAEIVTLLAEIGQAIQSLKEWMQPQSITPNILHKLHTCEIQAEPLGVGLIIGAFNYPVQLSLVPLVGMIAAGNVAIVKPSELAVHTEAIIARLIPKYLPSDCYKVVVGGIPETTALLKQRFDHIMYTGSHVVGKIVMRAASEYLTPVTLELGGKCPVVVDDNSSMDMCAQRIVWGKFSNAGQTCVAPDYILVSKRSQDKLVASLKKAVLKFYSANPKTSDSFGRIINNRHFQRLTKLIDASKVVHGGDSVESENYIAPTIMTNVTTSDAVMQEEIFGPLLPILNTDSMQDAINFILATGEKPLAAYVFSNNTPAIKNFKDSVSAGSLCVNDVVMQCVVEGFPFGGVGQSGMGGYHGKFSFDSFSHKKPMLIKKQALEMENDIRYPPYKKDWAVWTMAKKILVPSMTPKGRSVLPMLLLALFVCLLAFSFHSLDGDDIEGKMATGKVLLQKNLNTTHAKLQTLFL